MRSERRIIFIGDGPVAPHALAALRQSFAIAALLRSTDDEVSAAAMATGIRVERPSLESIDRLINQLAPDAVVVCSYDRILPRSLIDRCPFINVHYAPLPRYRGRATVNWAILNGETETAVTVHVLAEALDAGNILAQQAVAIAPRDTVGMVYDKLNATLRAILADAVTRRIEGDAGAPQDEAVATYAVTRLPRDGLVDWSESTSAIDRLIRSLGEPFPSAFSYLDATRVEIRSARPSGDARIYVGRIPGRVLRIDRQAGEVDVMTGDGVLTLELLAIAGAPARRASELVNTVKTTFAMSAGAVIAPITIPNTEPRTADKVKRSAV